VNLDVGVVIGFLGGRAHAVHEGERLGEVLELERPLQRALDLGPSARCAHP
jgi:hypothetical protein